jgi:hypothetical protein
MSLELGWYGEEMTLRIRQGGTFGPFYAEMKNPDLTPVDLTGCTITGQIRKKAKDTTVVCSIAFTIDAGTGGTYSFTIDKVTTALLECGESANSAASKYVYDIEMVDALGRSYPLYYGNVLVFREVTRV